MKLPGVQYRGVQGLARNDVNAPLRMAAAEAGASDAWSQVMRPAIEGSDAILTDIAKDRANKAFNIYNSEKLKWQSEQLALDENEDPAWENGDKRFNTADEAARAKASKVLGNSKYGQDLFTDSADRANVQYGASWQNKVQAWYKDDQLATGSASIELATQLRDFDKATEIITDLSTRGILNQVQTEKLFSVNSANRTNSEYLTAIESSNTIPMYSQLRQNIENEPKLSDAAREKMTARLDAQITENNTSALRVIMQTMEDNLGINIAVTEGRKLVHYIAGLTKEQETGFTTDKAQQIDRNAQLAVWREWEARLDKNTAATDMVAEMQCVFNNTCLPTTGKSNERRVHDNATQLAIGRIPIGKNKFNNNGVENTTILEDSPKGAEIRKVLSTLSRSGYLGKVTRETLDAGVTSNNPAYIAGAWDLVNEISQVAPNTLGDNLNPMTKRTLPVLQAFDKKRAVDILIEGKKLSPREREDLKDAFVTEEYDEAAFESLLKATMPESDLMGMWTSTPDFKTKFRNRVNSLAKDLYGITGGNVAASYKAAMFSVGKDYGTDQTLGRIVKDPISKNVEFGNVDDGDWAHDMINEQLPAFNNGEMPDSYDYYKIPGGGQNDYTLNFLDADGVIKTVVAEFNFGETERGRQYFKEEAEAATERTRLNLVAKDKVFAQSSEEAWDNAPDADKWRVTLDKIKEYQGKNAGSIGTAIDEMVGAVTGQGKKLGEALWEINQRKVNEMSAQSKTITEKHNKNRPASAKKWDKITGGTK